MRSYSKHGIVFALALVASVGLGCDHRMPSVKPTAADFFRPVGPLRLLREAGGSSSKAGLESEAESVAAGVADGTPMIPDSKLRLDLGMKLEDLSIATSRVEMVVDSQVVELSGAVRTSRARDRVELLARSIEGVRDVENRLRIDPGIDPKFDPTADVGTD